MTKRQRQTVDFAQWFGMRAGVLPTGEQLDAALSAFMRGKTVKLKVTPLAKDQRAVECWCEL